MAEQQRDYQFSAVGTDDILEERQEGWERFIQLVTWCIALIALALALLVVFVV